MDAARAQETPMLRRNLAIHFAIAALVLLPLGSCSTAPKKPKQGTPAFYWQAAVETLAKRDYLKTTEHLRRVIRSDNEYTQRAIPFRLAVSAGIAEAYLDLANEIHKGVKASKQPPAALRKSLMDHRLMAETRALEFTETLIAFNKAPKQDPVVLEFAFPPLGPSEPKELAQIQGGALPSPEVMALVAQRMVERGVPRAIQAAVGAPDDPAKARAAFQGGKAQVPREVFLRAMLQTLYKECGLFGRTALNKPDRLYIFATQGLEALKTMEENENNKLEAERFKALAKVAQTLQP
jgi:hypothetical protein